MAPLSEILGEHPGPPRMAAGARPAAKSSISGLAEFMPKSSSQKIGSGYQRVDLRKRLFWIDRGIESGLQKGTPVKILTKSSHHVPFPRPGVNEDRPERDSVPHGRRPVEWPLISAENPRMKRDGFDKPLHSRRADDEDNRSPTTAVEPGGGYRIWDIRHQRPEPRGTSP